MTFNSRKVVRQHTEGVTRSIIAYGLCWKFASLSSSERTLTRGQSNLTKSASRGPIPQLGITPGRRKLYH